MKAAFVFPPYGHRKFAENVSVVDEEFGKYPPIAIAYTAAILEDAGHDVLVVDANALGIGMDEAASRVIEFGAEVIAFNLHSVYSFFDTLEWVRFLKKKTGLPVVAGGGIAPDYPEDIMAYDEFDYLIFDDGMDSFDKVLKCISSGRLPRDVSGVGFRKKDGSVMMNRAKGKDCHKCPNLDDLPMPARHLLPNDRYYSFISKKKNFTIMLTSRGCPYRCVFCAIKRDGYSRRSVTGVIAEIEGCVKKQGIREIDFFDATFTASRKWTRELCSVIIERGLEFDWSCRTRVDCVDDETLSLMGRAGCKRIYYGIESADEDVIDAISKDITIDTVRDAIRLTKKHGIKALGFFMVGNPGDTPASIKKSVRLAKELELDYVQFSRTIPKPNTELEDSLTGEDRDYWRRFIRGDVPERRIKSNLSTMSDEEIERWTKTAYIMFYLRPSYVMQTLLEVKSAHELGRYFKAGWRMLTSYRFSDSI